jgi:hypothetical protein
MNLLTYLAIGAAVFLWPVCAGAEATWTRSAPLDQAIALRLTAGEEVVVDGAVRSSFDGSTYDAVGWFEMSGTGLRPGPSRDNVVGWVLRATGENAPTCRALGLASPCLVPQTRELAHVRLLTEREFVQTLSGSFQVSGSRAPAPTQLLTRGEQRGLSLGALSAVGAVVAAAGIAWRKKRRASPLGQVLIAADEARQRTRGDVTLAALRSQIDTLVARARELERIHRACADRQKWLARVSEARTEHVSSWAATERAEADRIEADRQGALAELDQIASALRVIALSTHASESRGASGDPLAAVAEELTLRQDAMREVERVR